MALTICAPLGAVLLFFSRSTVPGQSMATSTDIAAVASADRFEAAHACSRIDLRLRAVPWTLENGRVRRDRLGIDRTGQLRARQESLAKYLVEIRSKVLQMFEILPDAR